MKTDPILAPYYIAAILVTLATLFIADRVSEGRLYSPWRITWVIMACGLTALLLEDWYFQVQSYRHPLPDLTAPDGHIPWSWNFWAFSWAGFLLLIPIFYVVVAWRGRR